MSSSTPAISNFSETNTFNLNEKILPVEARRQVKELNNLTSSISDIDTGSRSSTKVTTKQQLFNTVQEFSHVSSSNDSIISVIKEKIKTLNVELISNPFDVVLIEEKTYWYSVLKSLEDNESIVKFYNKPTHERFTELYDTLKKTQSFDIESYREVLVKQFSKITTTSNYPHITKEQLTHLLTIKEKLQKKNFSISNLLNEYPEIFELLGLLDFSFDEVFETLTKKGIYPTLTNIYQKTQTYPSNLGVKAIYALYKSNTNNLLEEIIVYAKPSYVIDIGKHRIGQHSIYAEHIIEFLTIFKHQRSISFKEVSTVKDQVNPLLIYDTVKKAVPSLTIVLNSSLGHSSNVTEILSKKVDLIPENYIFSVKTKGLFSTTKFEYTLTILDKEGNEFVQFETSHYEMFEELITAFDYKIPKAQKEQVIQQFLTGIGKGKDKNTIDAYYSSLPSFLYVNDKGYQLTGANELLAANNLETDLRELLNGSVNDSGSSEELAIVNIIKAMPYDKLYSLLYKDTQLLYQIFDQLDGDEYKAFTTYLTTIINHLNKKSKGTILFSNEYWMFRNIHVSTSNWSGGNNISFETFQNIRNGFEDDGKGGTKVNFDKRVLNSIQRCHPLDIVTLSTKYPNKNEVPSMNVLAFELYSKVYKQKVWDWVNITTDVIGVLTIVGGTATLIGKGLAVGTRIAIGAGIAKEISSILIQNQKLTTWLKKDHKEVYKVWSTMDTTGNGVYLAMSLPQLARFISKGGKAIAGMTAKGYKSVALFSKSLAQAIKTFYYRLRFIATDIVNISKNYSSVNKVIDETELIIKELKNIESVKIKWNTGINKTIEAFHKNQNSVKSLIKQLKISTNIIEVNLKELKSIKSNLNNNLINNDLIKKVDKHIAKLSNLKFQNIEYLKKLNKIHDNIENKYVRVVSKIKTSIVYRVQGGVLPNASRTRILPIGDGSISILGDKKLYITIDDAKYQIYYYNKRGGQAKGAEIITFKVPKKFLDEIKRTAVTQDQLSEYKKLVNNKSKYDAYRSKHPEAADLTKSKSAYGLYGEEWFNKLKNNMIKGTFEIKKPK